MRLTLGLLDRGRDPMVPEFGPLAGEGSSAGILSRGFQSTKAPFVARRLHDTPWLLAVKMEVTHVMRSAVASRHFVSLTRKGPRGGPFCLCQRSTPRLSRRVSAR